METKSDMAEIHFRQPSAAAQNERKNIHETRFKLYCEVTTNFVRDALTSTLHDGHSTNQPALPP